MRDRNTRLQLARTELDRAIELASSAAEAVEDADSANFLRARSEAREALESAKDALNGVTGICEIHLRPIRMKLSDAERRLNQLPPGTVPM